MKKDYSSVKILNERDCKNTTYLLLDGEIFELAIMDVDSYRSELDIDPIEELPCSYEDMDEVFADKGNIKIIKYVDEHASMYHLYVNGSLIFEFGTNYSISYYPEGFFGFVKGEDKIDYEEPDYLYGGSVDINPINKSDSYIIVGEPRLGKTTFSKRFKGNVVDTDAFSNPMEVANHIEGNTCYVIGKWRDEIIEIEGMRVPYKKFIKILLGSLQTWEIAFSSIAHGKGDNIAIRSQDIKRLSRDFDISTIENMRDFCTFEHYILDVGKIKEKCQTMIDLQ